MEFNPVVITIAGVILLVLGIGAGWLLGSVGTDEGEPEPGSSEPAPPGGRKGRYTPVAKLWREKRADTLVVEIDGKAYTSVEGLNAPQREQLERSARDLTAFLGMGAVGAAAPVSAPTAEVEPTAPLPVAPATQAPPRQQPSLARKTPTPPPPVTPPAAAQPPAPARPIARTTPEPPAPSRPISRITPEPPPPAANKATPAAAKSIVMQIEDILQERIEGTPLATRGIHLSEDPARGVIVQVGLEFFEGIDAVPYPEVQSAIRAAVQTWENGR